MSEGQESPKLMPSRMQLAEHERMVYSITVETGVTREQLKDASFWSLIAAKLRPYDELIVHPDDGLFYAKYLVLACDRTWAKVIELSFHKLTTPEISETQAAIQNQEYILKHRGSHLKWSIIRKSDEAVIKEGIQTKDEADMALKEYIKTVTA